MKQAFAVENLLQSRHTILTSSVHNVNDTWHQSQLLRCRTTTCNIINPLETPPASISQQTSTLAQMQSQLLLLQLGLTVDYVMWQTDSYTETCWPAQ